jgi:hypothetical protein
VDLKPLPNRLKFEFLGLNKTYLVIVSDELSPEENDMLLNLLKKHKKVIGYSINDLKGLTQRFALTAYLWRINASLWWTIKGG